MKKKVLLTATVQSHICQFHKPLVQMLHDCGYQVHAAARNNLAEKNGLKLDFVDKVFDVPFSRSPKSTDNIQAYKQLKKIIDSEGYEIIHCNTPMGGIVTRLAARKARKNGTVVIYTAHGFHFYKGAPKKNWIFFYPVEKLFSRLTDKLITITQEDYNLAKEKFKTKVYHIHGVGADSSKYFPVEKDVSASYKKELGLDKYSNIIVNVGELLPNKNQKTAITAMKKVAKTFPNSILLIAGNGPEHDNLENLIRETGLENNVKLLGYTTKLNEYLNTADCAVACSFREGLPLNVMEAMMCGKGVVASDNRGHRELVEDGVTGYIVSPDDDEAFAEKIITVLSDPEKYYNSALEKAELFSDKNIYKELKEVYFNE